MIHTTPNPGGAALICINVPQDFTLPGATAEIPGTEERLPEMRRLAQAFRNAGRPVIHVVRLSLEDGRNVDPVRREAVERRLQLVAPGDEPRARGRISLDINLLLKGGFQPLGPDEWAMYKPRWDAFYATALETHLRGLGVDSLAFCGCDFPNCARASIYGASMRDFRILMVTDAVSGVYERGLEELKHIGVTVMDTVGCIRWLNEEDLPG